MTRKNDPLRGLHDAAYAASDAADLPKAVTLFSELIAQVPENASYHYMRGLAHKYLRNWAESLADNQRSIELHDDLDEASVWNAAIAATALQRWDEVRRLWSLVGMDMHDGGRVDRKLGTAVIRLNPWHAGETLWASRLDPVRARIDNVPYAESGHRYGDIVLHDGASTGSRDDGQGRQVHVFNELQLLERSEFATFVAFVSAPAQADRNALHDFDDGLGMIEDWTESVRALCLRCSYGAVHNHERRPEGDWNPDRNLGIAARKRADVASALAAWARAGSGRVVEAIESPEHEPPAFDASHPWWCGNSDEAGE